MKITNRLSIVSFLSAAFLAAVIVMAAVALFVLSRAMVESLEHSRDLITLSRVQNLFLAWETALEERMEAGGEDQGPLDRAVEEASRECRSVIATITADPQKSLAGLGSKLAENLETLDSVPGDTPFDRNADQIALLRDMTLDLAGMRARQQAVQERLLLNGVRTRNVAYSLFALATGIAVFGILYIQRRYAFSIIKPILRVSRAATRMAEGNLDLECPLEGPEELSRLGESLNNLSRSLRQKMGELREAVVKEQLVVRQLAVLNDIASLFFSELDLDQILNIVVKSGRDLVRAEYSLVFLVDKYRRITHVRSMGMEDANPFVLDEPRGLFRHVLEERMPVRMQAPFDHPAAAGFPDGHPEIRNFLAVPILVEGKPIGEFILGNRVGTEGFSEQDEDQVLHFSFLAAVGIEKAMLHQEVVRLAQTDGLTGLMNHRTFQEKIGEEISRGIRYERQASLLLIDIDHFKRFNDTFGHQAGDEILRRLACIFQENIRTIDCAARYGGEEFAIILSETGLEGARKTALRIMRELRGANKRFRGNGFAADDAGVTVSIGLAVYPEDGQTREDLIRAADEALYAAKRSGRDRLVTYRETTAMEPPVSHGET